MAAPQVDVHSTVQELALVAEFRVNIEQRVEVAANAVHLVRRELASPFGGARATGSAGAATVA